MPRRSLNVFPPPTATASAPSTAARASPASWSDSTSYPCGPKCVRTLSRYSPSVRMTAAKGTKSTRLTDAPRKSLSALWKNSVGLSPISSEPLLMSSSRLFGIFTARDDNTASARVVSFHVAHLVAERLPLDEQPQEELAASDEQQHGLEPAAHVVQLFERAQRHVAAQDRE